MKDFFRIIKELAPSVCFSFVWLLLSHPLLIIPTIKATVLSVKISAKHFPNGTGKGVGNAYKHALWNLLLAKFVRWRFSDDKALNWAKKVTDMHEDCVVNEELDRLMDLHNNKIGRQLYELTVSNQIETIEAIEDFLMEKATNAAVIKRRDWFKNYPYDMVYLHN